MAPRVLKDILVGEEFVARMHHLLARDGLRNGFKEDRVRKRLAP